MKKLRRTIATTLGAALLLGGGAVAANAATNLNTTHMWGVQDCTSLQRQVSTTGTARDHILVVAGSAYNGDSGSKGPYTRTAYSGQLRASWDIKGMPTITKGGPDCTIK